MRILFWPITFWPNIGGIEVLSGQLLAELQTRGHEIIVVTSGYDLDEYEVVQHKGLSLYRFPFWGDYANIHKKTDELIKVKQQLANLKRAFEPDLVHISGIGGFHFAHLITAQAHPVPLLVALHGEWPSEHDGLIRHILQAADWVTGCSIAILEKGRGLVPEIISRSSVVYNGLEVPSLPPEPLPFDPPRLLFLGRLYPEKGVDIILTAFASVVRRFPEARLIIAGDGPERTRLENQAYALGLTNSVEFIGELDNDKVPSVINNSTVVVMASRHESFPLVALEAALMARPVVATRVGGLPELVIHSHTGLLVEQENTNAMAAAIRYLLDHPQFAVKMGQTAKTRVQKEFAWKQHVDAYDSLYHKLIRDWQRNHLASASLE